MDNEMTEVVKYLSKVIRFTTNDAEIIRWLESYLSTSHQKNGVQPSNPEAIVSSYKYYFDSTMPHSSRIEVVLSDGGNEDISYSRFKKYVRRVYKKYYCYGN